MPDLQKVNAAGKHLLELINSILDLSKIEAGKMELHLEDFSVAKMIEDIAAMVQPLAEKNGNRLDVTCSAETGIMHADLTKVRQVLFNLLSNACKFTEKGTVSLAVQREECSRWRLAELRGARHRHRLDARAAGTAVSGVLAGRRRHRAQVRRNGPRAWRSAGGCPG